MGRTSNKVLSSSRFFSAGADRPRLHTATGVSWLGLYIVIGALLILSGCRAGGARSQSAGQCRFGRLVSWPRPGSL